LLFIIAGLVIIISLTDALPSADKSRIMIKIIQNVAQNLFPPVPQVIHDDFIRLTGTRLQSQSRLLFLALLLTVPTAIHASSGGASLWVRVGLPVVMGTACLLGFLSLCRDLRISTSVRRAQRLIKESTWVSSGLAVICSVWCVMSWKTAPIDMKIYYPLILSMGSLATAYSLSSVRLAAILNLAIGLLPISTLLLISGDRMDMAAGTSLAVATAFLLHMIVKQHDQLVDLLMLQRQMRELANTDPLTGLLNRRALDKRLEQELESAGTKDHFSYALLDLDGFKPVNDRYGHATGDLLLCEVATRLQRACGNNGVVARLGGDEFAVLIPSGSPLASLTIADHLLETLITPCRIGDHQIRIGASIGVAHWPADGTTQKALFETADRALYAVKAQIIRQSFKSGPSDHNTEENHSTAQAAA
jgi:diguanylate cyclase